MKSYNNTNAFIKTTFREFLNEQMGNVPSNLQGSPISLIKTLQTAKYNRETGTNDFITKDYEVSGFISEIGLLEPTNPEFNMGYKQPIIPGFWLVDENGRKKEMVMFDEKGKEFIDGNSNFHYTYTGATEQDNQLLNQILDLTLGQ